MAEVREEVQVLEVEVHERMVREMKDVMLAALLVGSLLAPGCHDTQSTPERRTIKVDVSNSNAEVKKKASVDKKQAEKEVDHISQFYQASGVSAAAGEGPQPTEEYEAGTDKGVPITECFYGPDRGRPDKIRKVKIHIKPQVAEAFAKKFTLIKSTTPVEVTVEVTEITAYLWKHADWPSELPMQTHKSGDPTEKEPAAWAKATVGDLSAISTSGITFTLADLEEADVNMEEVLDISFAAKLKFTSTTEDLYFRTDENIPLKFTGDDPSALYAVEWFETLFEKVEITLNDKTTLPLRMLSQRFYSGQWSFDPPTSALPKELKIAVQHIWTENWIQESAEASPEEQAAAVLQKQYDLHTEYCPAGS